MVGETLGAAPCPRCGRAMRREWGEWVCWDHGEQYLPMVTPAQALKEHELRRRRRPRPGHVPARDAASISPAPRAVPPIPKRMPLPKRMPIPKPPAKPAAPDPRHRRCPYCPERFSAQRIAAHLASHTEVF